MSSFSLSRSSRRRTWSSSCLMRSSRSAKWVRNSFSSARNVVTSSVLMRSSRSLNSSSASFWPICCSCSEKKPAKLVTGTKSIRCKCVSSLVHRASQHDATRSGSSGACSCWSISAARARAQQQWRFHAWAGRGHSPLQIVAGPPNSAVLLTHCGQLILRERSKFDGTRCQIIRLKCIKFDFCWDSALEPAGELTTIPQTPSCI